MRGERHRIKSPIVSLFVVCTAVGSAVFGVTRYFHEQDIARLQQDYQSRLGQAESQMARMNVGIGEVGDFDIQQIVSPLSDTVSLPESASFFGADSFYALRSDDCWDYSETTEDRIFEMVSGQSLADTELAGAANLIPVHLWTGGETWEILHENQTTRMKSMIMLQRIPLDKLRQLTGMATGEPQSPVRQASFETEIETPESMELYEAIVDDMTGKFFQFQTWLELGQSLNSPLTSHHLKRVEKLANTLYSQSTTVMKQASVNGQSLPAFYVHNQMILISNRDGLYYVKIILPSSEPALRDKTMAAVNRWLANLRIITN